jgi:triacylglycerol lipase
MPKPLPPSTTAALSPPASAAFPYAFFENVAAYPFQPADAALNLRNAWWLMDAAFLAYSAPNVIEATFARAPLSATVTHFSGPLSTECYVASSPEWIVLAFRGTQVDNFWSSVIDWSVDARFLPVPDRHRDWVHEGFSAAVRGVWKRVVKHIKSLQAAAPRPLWVTGHSLGAALATVAANLLCADQPEGLGIRGLYTYGSPRVGDNGFGRRITVPVYRFRNNTDLVTHVPLGLVFHHVGRLQFIDSGGSIHRDVGPAEELLLNAGALQLSAYQAHNLAALMRVAGQGVPLPGFLAEHAPINYGIRIWNCFEVT